GRLRPGRRLSLPDPARLSRLPPAGPHAADRDAAGRPARPTGDAGPLRRDRPGGGAGALPRRAAEVGRCGGHPDRWFHRPPGAERRDAAGPRLLAEPARHAAGGLVGPRWPVHWLPSPPYSGERGRG